MPLTGEGEDLPIPAANKAQETAFREHPIDVPTPENAMEIIGVGTSTLSDTSKAETSPDPYNY